MSIISDALKKTQTKRSTSRRETESIVQVAPNSQELADLLKKKSLIKDLKRKSNFSRRGPVRLISLALVFIGTAALVMYFTRFAIMNAANEPVGIQKPIAIAEIKKNIAQLKETLKTVDVLQTPTLNGIMYTPTSPQAIINDTIVTEGDMVSGFSVVKISPESVMVSSGEEEFELELQ